MAESTLAERRLLGLQRDLRSDYQDLLRDHPEAFNRRALRQIKKGEGVLRQLEESGGLSAATWSEMRERIHLPSAQKRRLNRLLFVDLDLDEAAAICVVEPDDSAMVRVSDGLMSLLMFLSGLHTYLLLGRRTSFQTVRLAASVVSMEKGYALQRAKVTDLLLRDFLIENKLNGGRAKAHPDLSPKAEAMTMEITLAAYWFVLAHEAGHFLLGHPTAGFTSMETDTVPVIAENARLEHDADELALELTQAMYAGTTGDHEPYNTALLGAGIALLAIYLIERGMMLRPARTHPASEDRWTLLTERAERPEGWGPGIDYLYSAIVSATSAPGSYPERDWAELPAAGGRRWGREIRKRLSTLPAYDHLLNGSLETMNLSDVAREHAGIATAVRAQSSAHTVDEALLGMGVDQKLAARVADPETALSFHRLLSVIQNSEAFSSLPSSELSLISGAILTRRMVALIDLRPSLDSDKSGGADV